MRLEQAAKLFLLFDALLRQLGHTGLPTSVEVLWHPSGTGVIRIEIVEEETPMRRDTVDKLRWFWRVIVLRRDPEGICYCGRYKGHSAICRMNP